MLLCRNRLQIGQAGVGQVIEIDRLPLQRHRRLIQRGELDNIPELGKFADTLERACIKTIEDGKMTKDLALITTMENPVTLNTQDFISAIRKTLEELL